MRTDAWGNGRVRYRSVLKVLNVNEVSCLQGWFIFYLIWSRLTQQMCLYFFREEFIIFKIMHYTGVSLFCFILLGRSYHLIWSIKHALSNWYKTASGSNSAIPFLHHVLTACRKMQTNILVSTCWITWYITVWFLHAG